MSFNFKKIALVVGLALFLAGVGLFAYLGYYNRYWADDWCYNADFKNLGFIETLSGYAYNVTYTPSRYSVTIFAGLIQAFGILGMQLMTPLTVIFWVAGLAYLFYNVAQMAGHQLSKWLVVLVASVIVYFSIYLSPHIYQSLYWRTGMLTYVTPLVFLPWIFVFITEQSKREKPSALLTAFIFRSGAAWWRLFRSQQHGIGIHIGIVCAHRRDRLPPEAALGCEDLRPGVGGAGRRGGWQWPCWCSHQPHRSGKNATENLPGWSNWSCCCTSLPTPSSSCRSRITRTSS